MDEAFLRAILEKLLRLNAWARRQPTWLWALLIVVGALLYYGSYFRHDLRFRDEGGTTALNGQRLLAGERPIVDVVLNYNVLWFYPIAGLFKWFGVNFVLMTAYFLALSTVTALLGFFAVRRAGREPLVAAMVALVLILVPGMTYKNYIPLLVVANSLLLMLTALSAPGSTASYLRIAGGGILLGITYLIRIDLGFFCTVLWLGLHALRLLDREIGLGRKIVAAFAGIVLTLGLAALVHVPVVKDAKARGFDEPFLHQYHSLAHFIEREARLRLGLPPPKPLAADKRRTASGASPVFWNKETLRRNAWHDLARAQDFHTGSMVVLTYLPIVTLLTLLGWVAIRLCQGLRASDPEAYRRPLAALVLIGGSLIAFPQFFFFRPDAPHLSEFSPGYWVAVTGVTLLLGGLQSAWRHPVPRFAHLLLILVAAHLALYLARMLPDRWTGTIAARFGNSAHFQAENGVDVYVAPGDAPVLEALCQVVKTHARPDDYLVVYPYHPTINVMTNRRTYERDVYIDNSTRTRHWDREAIERFEKFRPAVIVLSDWAVNGHDESRFSRWAAPTREWIVANYQLQGTFKTSVDEFEVYVRP